MKIYVLHKTAFDEVMRSHNITMENVESFVGTCFISIVGTLFSNAEVPFFSFNKSNVIVLRFDDIDHDCMVSGGIAKAMTIEQARELFEFIKRNANKETFILHCAAGISRSGAVGYFINEYFGGDWETFKKTNPQVYSNIHVLTLLRKIRAENV